jgi:ABC-type nickel/cobalt efflux system permease component RcnA
MRRTLMLTGLALVAGLGLLWLTGALDGVARWVASAQRAAQDQLAGAIRALRAHEPGALMAFWAVCLGYGVLHAAGPGHGKLIIGGYGVARRVPVGRLAGLALISSLAQAAVAVALVYALVAVLGLTRGAVETAAEDWVTPVGHAMIAGLGLWLVWRGIGGLRRQAEEEGGHSVPAVAGGGHNHDHHDNAHHTHHDHHHDQDYHHAHDHGHEHNAHHDHGHHGHDTGHVHGPDCGHAHGPTIEEVEGVRSFRDALALVAGIALRPCSGALFVLVLTWQLGIAMAGVVGAFVMGLGTAAVTIGVAVMAVWSREGAFAALPQGRVARAIPVVELGLGGVIAAAALGLLAQSL